MFDHFVKKYSVVGLCAAMAFGSMMPLAAAVPSGGTALTRLTTQEQARLQAGEAVVTGENGRYVGRILIPAPLDAVWTVLTDYDRFQEFLPDVVSSRILETQGDRIVFEQVNQVRVLLLTQKSRLVITALKQYPKEINFQLKEGNIKSLKGVWKVDTLPSQQILVTQEVTFDPGDAVPRGLAFAIYKNALGNSLKAIRQETERRLAQPLKN